MVDFMTSKQRDLLDIAASKKFQLKTDLSEAERDGLVRKSKNRKPVLTKTGQQEVKALIRCNPYARCYIIFAIGLRTISSKRYSEVFSELVEDGVIRAPIRENRWILTKRGNQEAREHFLSVRQWLDSLQSL